MGVFGLNPPAQHLERVEIPRGGEHRIKQFCQLIALRGEGIVAIPAVEPFEFDLRG